METKYFSLDINDNNRFVKIIRIVFGIVCFSVALFWLVFNIRSLKTDGALWITIIFLSGFGLYQVWSGTGHASRFIEIGQNNIRLKKNPIFPPVEMTVAGIEKIDMFPLSTVFYMKTNKKILLRFGTTYYETTEKVKNEIVGFAESNKILLEIMDEKI